MNRVLARKGGLEKAFIIDPLTTICKMALLSYLPDRTKISINNHVLVIQEHTRLQGLERLTNGDSRSDIVNLNVPLIKVVKWYLVPGPESVTLDQVTLEAIRSIARLAVQGLKQLQIHTYHDDPMIRIVLQYFAVMIQDAVDGQWSDDKYPEFSRGSSVMSERIKEHFEGTWVVTLAKWLQEQPGAFAIDRIHTMLKNRDREFLELMTEAVTTL